MDNFNDEARHETVPTEFSKLLEALEAVGFKNATLYGGALRDHYMGQADKIKDYDVIANFGDLAGKSKEDIITALGKIDGFSGTEHYKVLGTCSEGAENDLHVKVNLGKDSPWIDLHITTKTRILEDKAKSGEAPIESIAMNAAGEILAHPDFIKHIIGRVYAPRNTNGLSSDEFADHILDRHQRKYPDFKLERPWAFQDLTATGSSRKPNL